MNAIAKMKAYGVEALAQRTGHHVSVLYRWIKAIESGDGIRDANKRKLIDATAASEHAIVWADFYHQPAAAA